MRTPTLTEIVAVLSEHRLIRLQEKPSRGYLIGSFAGGGRAKPNAESDVDILLEVPPVLCLGAERLAELYRRPLQQCFVTLDIRGKADHLHPQWEGRRVDLYFTYDADLEKRPKILLAP